MTRSEKFYAGFWVRLFAGLLDMVFLAPVFAILIYTFGINEFESVNFSDSLSHYSYALLESKSNFSDFVTYGISITYVAYFLSGKKQATFGKRLMGIYVGNVDGSKLSIAKAITRAAASLLTTATLGLGFFIVIFTKEKISLHDFICGTRVFHGRKNA